MKKQEFGTEDLKVALEQITGRRLKPLLRVVKCYLPHQAMDDRFRAIASEAEGCR